MKDKVLALNAEALARTIEELKVQVVKLQEELSFKRILVDSVAKEKLLTILGIAAVCLEEENFSKEEVMVQINKAINLLNSLN